MRLSLYQRGWRWVGVASSLLAVVLSSAGAADLTSAQVVETRHLVKYQSETVAERAAQIGDQVAGTDVVRTGEKSLVELEFNTKAISRLGPKTVFTFQPANREFHLTEGVGLFCLPKGSGGGRIVTSTITAAIEGTTVLALGAGRIIFLEGRGTILTNDGKQRQPIQGGQLAVLENGKLKIYSVDLAPIMRARLITSRRNVLPTWPEVRRVAADQQRRAQAGRPIGDAPTYRDEGMVGVLFQRGTNPDLPPPFPARGQSATMTRWVLIGLMVWAGRAAPGRAQSPVAPSTPAAVAAEPVEVEDEDEFEALLAGRAAPRHKWFSVHSQTDYTYHSNILLLPDVAPYRELDDTLVSQTFGLGVHAPLWHDLQVSGFVQHQLVRYDTYDEFDYDTQTIGLQASYPVRDWFNVHAQFSANRWYLDNSDNEFFKMYNPRFGLWRSDPLADWVRVFYGYQLDWRPSSPAIFNRVDNTFYAGAQVTVFARLIARAYYQLSVQESLEIDRTDLNHLVSGTLDFAVCEYARLSAFLRYTNNDSSLRLRDYEVFEGGGGLSLNVRF